MTTPSQPEPGAPAAPAALTSRQLGDALGVSSETIRRWWRAGRITPLFPPAPGGETRWSEHQVRAQLDAEAGR